MITAIERPQTYGLDRMATEIGIWKIYPIDLGLEVTDKVQKDRKTFKSRNERKTQYTIVYFV
jgi:hypothetical protein